MAHAPCERRNPATLTSSNPPAGGVGIRAGDAQQAGKASKAGKETLVASYARGLDFCGTLTVFKRCTTICQVVGQSNARGMGLAPRYGHVGQHASKLTARRLAARLAGIAAAAQRTIVKEANPDDTLPMSLSRRAARRGTSPRLSLVLSFADGRSSNGVRDAYIYSSARSNDSRL